LSLAFPRSSRRAFGRVAARKRVTVGALRYGSRNPVTLWLTEISGLWSRWQIRDAIRAVTVSIYFATRNLPGLETSCGLSCSASPRHWRPRGIRLAGFARLQRGGSFGLRAVVFRVVRREDVATAYAAMSAVSGSRKRVGLEILGVTRNVNAVRPISPPGAAAVFLDLESGTTACGGCAPGVSTS